MLFAGWGRSVVPSDHPRPVLAVCTSSVYPRTHPPSPFWLKLADCTICPRARTRPGRRQWNCRTGSQFRTGTPSCAWSAASGGIQAHCRAIPACARPIRRSSCCSSRTGHQGSRPSSTAWWSWRTLCDDRLRHSFHRPISRSIRELVSSVRGGDGHSSVADLVNDGSRAVF